MGAKVANNAYALLASSITTASTSITVGAGTGDRFPVLGTGDYFYATLIDTSNNLEIVKVTARTGDTMTVIRGQEGTTAKAYAVNDRIELRLTAALFATKEDAGVAAQIVQGQSATAVTTSGSAPSFTVTTNPPYGAYAANQRMRVAFHAAGVTGSNTLNRDGLGAKNLVQYGSIGTKVPATITAGQLADVEYDGTDMVVLNPLSASGGVFSSVPVRQTVIQGPVDSNGLPAFGGSTGSTTVTVSGQLTITAAAGYDLLSGAPIDHTAVVTNPSWTGLSTNGINYLYINTESLETGSTTLAPLYSYGGTASIATGQLTFIIRDMKMYLGDDVQARAGSYVLVGEVLVASGVVSTITWYALNGRYASASTPISTSQTYTFAHNIGVPVMQLDMDAWIRDTVNNYVLPYHIDSNIDYQTAYNNYAFTDDPSFGSKIIKVRTASAAVLDYLSSVGTQVIRTSAELFVRIKRGW